MEIDSSESMYVHYFAFSNVGLHLQFYFPVTQGCKEFCKSRKPAFVFSTLNNSTISLSFVISLSTLLPGLFMNMLNSMSLTTEPYGIPLVTCEGYSYAHFPSFFPHPVINSLKVPPFVLLCYLSGQVVIENLPIYY